MGVLNGKAALVLGAGHIDNMGAEIARRFVREGARVLVGGRDATRMAAIADALGGEPIDMDIIDEAAVARAAAQLRARVGELHVLVNAVGIHRHSSIASIEPNDLDALARAHLHGPAYLLKHVAPLMPAGGAVVMISSVSAQPNNNPPGVGVYGATKAATDKLMQVAAIEYGPLGLRVNAIAPGLVLTPMGEQALGSMGQELIQRMVNRTPLGRLATTADIAGAALFLVSDDCFLTGQILQVNGGFDLYDAGVPANAVSVASQSR